MLEYQSDAFVLVFAATLIMNPSWVTLGAFGVAVLNHCHRRVVRASELKRSRMQFRHEALELQIGILSRKLEAFEKLTEDVKKQSEDAKKILSQVSVSNAFGGRR